MWLSRSEIANLSFGDKKYKDWLANAPRHEAKLAPPGNKHLEPHLPQGLDIDQKNFRMENRRKKNRLFDNNHGNVAKENPKTKNYITARSFTKASRGRPSPTPNGSVVEPKAKSRINSVEVGECRLLLCLPQIHLPPTQSDRLNAAGWPYATRRDWIVRIF